MPKKTFTKLPGAEKLNALKIKMDSWFSLVSGMGTSKDSLKSTKFQANADITELEAEALYVDNGLAGRIVDKPTGDMVREWFKIIGDPDGDINRYLHQNLKAMNKVRQALRWEKVFGGCVIQMGIMDGKDLTEPVDMNNIREVEFLRVYDRYRVNISSANILTPLTPNDDSFGAPQIMQISPIPIFTKSATPFPIHVDRLLIFPGIQSSSRKMSGKEGWGDSIYVKTQEGIRDYAIAHHSAAHIIKGLNQMILTIDSLADLIATDEGTELVKKRLEILDMARSIMNMVLLDKDEKHDIQTQSAAGVSEIIQTAINRVSTDTGIPPSILIGQAKSGLNSRATEDQDLYNALVKEMQIFDLKPQMEKLVEIVMASSSGPTSGKIIPDWAIQFNPLETPSELETAEQRDKTADTDRKYWEMDVLSNQEIRASRFRGNEYSIETKINPEFDPQNVDPDDDPNKDSRDDDLNGRFLISGITNKHAHHGFVDFDGNGRLFPAPFEDIEPNHDHPISNWVVEEVDGHTHGIDKGGR